MRKFAKRKKKSLNWGRMQGQLFFKEEMKMKIGQMLNPKNRYFHHDAS